MNSRFLPFGPTCQQLKDFEGCGQQKSVRTSRGCGPAAEVAHQKLYQRLAIPKALTTHVLKFLGPESEAISNRALGLF